jgi:hypothetical protein
MRRPECQKMRRAKNQRAYVARQPARAADNEAEVN